MSPTPPTVICRCIYIEVFDMQLPNMMVGVHIAFPSIHLFNGAFNFPRILRRLILLNQSPSNEMTRIPLMEYGAINSFAKVQQIRLGNCQRIALSPRADLHHLLYCNKLSISKLQLLHNSFAVVVWRPSFQTKEIRMRVMKLT